MACAAILYAEITDYKWHNDKSTINGSVACSILFILLRLDSAIQLCVGLQIIVWYFIFECSACHEDFDIKALERA